EGVAAPPEGAAVATHHVVLLDQQHRQPLPGEQVGRDQAADAGADHHRVVGRVGQAAERPERPLHGSPPPARSASGWGRLRPSPSWAATNSALEIAPPIDSSPASRVAAAISASRGAPPGPAQPSISRHSRPVPSPVPPPTVATVSAGRVTLA